MTERSGAGARMAADEDPRTGERTAPGGEAGRAGAEAGAAAGPRSGESSALSPVALAERIARIASERKAIDVRLLDLRGVVSYTDYLVICSGNTDRQTRAIHEAIHRELKDSAGLLPRRVEGEREARWILLDYLDCVAHIFTPDARSYYRLEQLWGEVPSRAVE